MFDFLSFDFIIFRAELNFVLFLKDSMTLKVLVSISVLFLFYRLGLGIGAIFPQTIVFCIQSF